MSEEIDRQENAFRYLLGKLSTEDEKARLEERYFTDDSEFEQLEIAEDELIEKYVRNELSTEDTRSFEKLLVSPGLSERVEVARLLVKRSAPAPQVVTTPASIPVTPVRFGWWDRLFGPAAVPVFRPAFAMSLVFLLLTTTALVFVWTKLRAESQRLAQEQQQREMLRQQIEQEQARYRQLQGQLDKTQQEKDEQAALAEKYHQLLAEAQQRSPVPALPFPIDLSPDSGTRGSGGPGTSAFKIPQGVPLVGFSLNVTHGGDDYPRYNAVLRNMDTSQQIATKSNLKPVTERGRKYIRFNVEANRLGRGSYRVNVDGVTSTGETQSFDEYNFRISR